MNRLQKIVTKLTPKFVKQSVIKSYSSNNNFSSWIGKTFFGIENNSLETNENIFSVVSRLSNTLSSLPFKKYLKYEQQFDDEMDRLIYYPNGSQTLDDIFKVLEVSRNTNGNGYAVIFRDIRLQVEKIVPLIPICVNPVMEKNTKELWYQVSNEGRNYYFHNSDIIHVKHISSNGNWKGISPIDVLKNATDFDKAVREFSLKEMQSLRDSFILTYGASLDDEKKAKVVEDFKRFYEDNGGILFQEPGVEIKEMTRNFVAGDVEISEGISKDRIANVFNVPSVFLNKDGSSFASNEQLMQLFVNMTLTPIVKQYEREFNKKVLTKKNRIEGYYFKFNMNALLRGDSESRKNFYHGAIRDGWMTQDEVRMLEELPPKGGRADDLWISGDMYPIEMDPRDRKTSNRSRDVVNDD